MPSRVKAPSPEHDLARALGTMGKEEYQRLLRMVRVTSGRFALLPIESDLRPALRDALLERLGGDLAATGLSLRVVRLSQEVWDLRVGLETDAEEAPLEVMAVVGLGDTPGIVPEPGATVQRPPALAILNHLREALRKRISAPLLLWCDPLTYTALQDHAPDFFDHFTALFTFLDAAPVQAPAESIPARLSDTELARAVQRQVISSRVAVAFYEEQVEKLSEPTVERARALLGLANALWPLRDRDLIPRLARAKAAAEEALTILSPEDEGTEWARGQVILGIIFGELPTGNRAANLQRTIDCCQAALRVYTEADFPHEWATTQNNLGNAYGSLPTGDRDKNLRLAIVCYQAALRVHTEADFPQEWARTQSNLGNAYGNLPTGNRDENLRQAIVCFQAALRVYTEADFPQEWARIQNNLGGAYADLPTGNRDENLRQAIACFQAALRVHTEADFPQAWARIENNLGEAYRNLLTGNRDENLRQAIACFQAALRVYTEADFPQEWAMTQSNLGGAYYGLLTGNRKQNLRRAIACCQAVLPVFTEADFPQEWANTESNHAVALNDLAEVTQDNTFREQAAAGFRAAARGFRAVGVEDKAQEVEEEAERIEALLVGGDKEKT